MNKRNHALHRLGALLLVFALALAAAGCGLARRPTPDGEPEVPPAPNTASPPRTITAALFFADWQAQHLIPEQRQLPEATGEPLATEVVNELLAGPTDPHLMRTIPEGVKLLEPVTIQNKVANVNLSGELRSLRGSAAVSMALGSLRLSLTELEGIDQVNVLLDGMKDAELDGMVLEPMDRGLYDYPVLPDPSRTAYLQGRFENGLDPWRADPMQVAQWEGRMFGFTAAELQGAHLDQAGAQARVTVTRGGKAYGIELIQNQAVTRGEGIWTIESLSVR